MKVNVSVTLLYHHIMEMCLDLTFPMCFDGSVGTLPRLIMARLCELLRLKWSRKIGCSISEIMRSI